MVEIEAGEQLEARASKLESVVDSLSAEREQLSAELSSGREVEA